MRKQGHRTVQKQEVAYLTVHVGLGFARKGGRKTIVMPGGSVAASLAQPTRLPDHSVLKALARAFRWRRLIDAGVYATVDEMASAEHVNPSYLSRVLRLTLLAPDIIEDLLGGRRANAPLSKLLEPFSVCWVEQRAIFHD